MPPARINVKDGEKCAPVKTLGMAKLLKVTGGCLAELSIGVLKHATLRIDETIQFIAFAWIMFMLDVCNLLLDLRVMGW